MSELKLTIDQLKNYLVNGLKAEMLDYKSDYVNKQFDQVIGLHQWDKRGELWCVLTEGGSKPSVDRIRPVLYRLSDLDKFIPEFGLVPAEKIFYGAWNVRFKEMLNLKYSLESSWFTYKTLQLLFQWNFWPFGDEYFEEGLIIDKLNIQTK